MTNRGLAPTDLDPAGIEEFLADRRADRSRRVPYRRGLLLLLEHLTRERVITPVDTPARTALDELIEVYRGWLIADRGLAATTVLRYERTARRFLGYRPGVSGVDVAEVNGAEVSAFLLAECARCSVGAAKGRVAELRSLLRYLYLRGMTPLPLAAAIPPVAGWHDTGIPPTMSAAQLQALLDSCDRTSAAGARDFAIMTLVARLGLRSIEVARLQLDDVNWRTGEIIVCGKARRRDRMPLPVDVGDALAAYLRDGRPSIEHRQLFVTCRAPRRGIRADLVGGVVQRACRRAGLPAVGPHRLRHTLASQLLAKGVALSDISQVLRHQDLATTAVYAKVDLGSLRAVGRPWPGTQR